MSALGLAAMMRVWDQPRLAGLFTVACGFLGAALVSATTAWMSRPRLFGRGLHHGGLDTKDPESGVCAWMLMDQNRSEVLRRAGLGPWGASISNRSLEGLRERLHLSDLGLQTLAAWLLVACRRARIEVDERWLIEHIGQALDESKIAWIGVFSHVWPLLTRSEQDLLSERLQPEAKLLIGLEAPHSATARHLEWAMTHRHICRDNAWEAATRELEPGLIWCTLDDSLEVQSTFRRDEDGSCVDVHGEVVAPTGAVGVLHPGDLGARDMNDWHQHLADHELVGCEFQLSRRSIAACPGEEFAGKEFALSNQEQVRSHPGDAPLLFPIFDIKVALIPNDTGRHVRAVEFLRGGRLWDGGERLFLEQVPRFIISEAVFQASSRRSEPYSS